jgi:transcriptional regulator with XRE-family HTH domain
MTDKPVTYGTTLAELLDRRGLTIRGFAKSAGVSHTLIRKIISGEKTPHPDDLIKWAEYFQLSGDDRQHFIDLGRSARAKGKKDSANYIAEVETSVKRLESALSVALAHLRTSVVLLEQKGVQVPRGMSKALRDLDELLDALG